jgi:uncharacterized membrane protein YhaH (DUF805 family)
MPDENPYTAPDAELSSASDELYQPSIFSFQGRIGRLRYMAYGIGVGFLVLLLMIPVIFLTVGLEGFAEGGAGIMTPIFFVIMGLFMLGSLVVTIMFGKRRLNDLGRSGWWSILLLIPYVQLIPAIYLIFFAGNKGDNHYGAEPCANSVGVIILAFLLPGIAVLGIVAAIVIPMIAGN